MLRIDFRCPQRFLPSPAKPLIAKLLDGRNAGWEPGLGSRKGPKFPAIFLVLVLPIQINYLAFMEWSRNTLKHVAPAASHAGLNNKQLYFVLCHIHKLNINEMARKEFAISMPNRWFQCTFQMVTILFTEMGAFQFGKLP